MASPAGAAPRQFNRANIEMRGGNARALSLCVNVARAYARAGRPMPRMRTLNCGGAQAVGGNVVVSGVQLVVDQSGYRSSNSATVVLSGGDATAVAACLNYSQGRGTTVTRTQCAGARAQGGNVSVRDSNIIVTQG